MAAAFQILLPKRIDITSRDHEGQLVIDRHQLPSGLLFHRHGELAALAQGFIDRERALSAPRLGRCAQRLVQGTITCRLKMTSVTSSPCASPPAGFEAGAD
ncbi:MAG: hypothetical protein IPK05_19295 [Comamonadaceae bacterium]|nr:hypothetical protein [Comamonadaceae bacterium]